MGWGYYLVARRNHGTEREERKELIYWRKFDDLFHSIRGFIRYEPDEDDGNGEVVLNKEQLRQILQELIITEDYWADHAGETLVPGVSCTNGFGTVEKMCEIVAQYNLITEEGWEIVFFKG